LKRLPEADRLHERGGPAWEEAEGGGLGVKKVSPEEVWLTTDEISRSTKLADEGSGGKKAERMACGGSERAGRIGLRSRRARMYFALYLGWSVLLARVLDNPVPLMFEDEKATNWGGVVERAPNAPTTSSLWSCTVSPTHLFKALHELAYAETCGITRYAAMRTWMCAGSQPMC
jgi:hypothetical protein